MSETTELTRTGADGDGAIIRADKRGRARYDAAFRRRVVEAYARSGMSAMAFASHWKHTSQKHTSQVNS